VLLNGGMTAGHIAVVLLVVALVVVAVIAAVRRSSWPPRGAKATAAQADPGRPVDPGYYGWFALVSLVLAVLLGLAQVGVLAGLFLLLALMWGVIWLVRVRRVVQWARQREAAPRS
jgi:hypothetical protein